MLRIDRGCFLEFLFRDFNLKLPGDLQHQFPILVKVNYVILCPRTILNSSWFQGRRRPRCRAYECIRVSAYNPNKQKTAPCIPKFRKLQAIKTICAGEQRVKRGNKCWLC